ncbi:MAG: DUF4292 domain-containing protein [Porphyromonadaceae bacterium]|nr:MAG: DUF4292 domain-containing protein [Porphyromonadaceae bacterium]
MNAMKPFKYTGFFCLVILIFFTLNGCHLAKKTVSGMKTMTEDENLVRKVMNTQPDWKFIEIRLTGRGEENDSKIGFMGTVKIEKDSQVFILLRSTIGIELLRIYANRDSIWLVSKMLSIKEKGDWKLAGGKLGYPVDFFAMQGILLQSLFTSSGGQLNNLIENLVVKSDKDDLRLVSNTHLQTEEKGIKYLNDFLINKETFIIQDAKIRDINGQWIADIKYTYNKDNLIKKIELKGIDSERNFAMDVNIVKKEIKDFIEINFDKF